MIFIFRRFVPEKTRGLGWARRKLVALSLCLIAEDGVFASCSGRGGGDGRCTLGEPPQ